MRRSVSMTLVVAGLGYFVDTFDMAVFSIVRIPSLTDLGLPAEHLNSVGIWLLNLQSVGLLIGGLLWGTLGDRRGRLKILYGSILLYSTANLINGFATTVSVYGACRFFS